jgi:peroxiredoxin
MMHITKFLIAAVPLLVLGCAGQQSAEDDGLQDKLDDRKAQWAAGASDETKKAYDDGIEEVRASGVLDSMKQVGDRAPGFTLPNATGKEVSLSDLLADGPVIVVFYRGAWCPYCNMTLAAWQQELETIHGLGAELVAISPQVPDYSLTTQEKNDLQFPVLSDVNNHVADRFGITTQVTPEILELWEGKIDLEEHNAQSTGKLPLPATFLIDTDSKIVFAHAHQDYRVRAEPGEVIEKLREIQSDQAESTLRDARERRARRM